MATEVLTLETLDFTIRIGSTPNFSYFDLYIYMLVNNLTKRERMRFVYLIFRLNISIRPGNFYCSNNQYLENALNQ